MEEMQTTEEFIQQDNKTTEDVVNGSSPENKVFDSFVNSLSDLLLSHDDFEYNIVRSAAERVGDDFDIEQHLDMDDFKSDVARYVQEDIDYDEIANHVSDELDYSEIAEKLLRNIDMYDLASDVKDYIDIDDMASDVEDRIDLDDSVSNIAERLLIDYDPARNCNLGDKFTEAVGKAINHLVEMRDNSIARVRYYESTVSETLSPQVEEQDASTDQPEFVITEITDEDNNESIEVNRPDDDFIYDLLKRVVNDLMSGYVPTFSNDPFMRIRMEAKAFDIYHEMKKG